MRTWPDLIQSRKDDWQRPLISSGSYLNDTARSDVWPLVVVRLLTRSLADNNNNEGNWLTSRSRSRVARDGMPPLERSRVLLGVRHEQGVRHFLWR